MSEIREGAFYEVAHPFIMDDYSGPDEGGDYFEGKSWRPGVRSEASGPEDVECVADGVGSQRLTVVGIYKPGRFPTRIFYTREWTSPAGKAFGNTRLLIATKAKFSRLIAGYRVPFIMASPVLTSTTEGVVP